MKQKLQFTMIALLAIFSSSCGSDDEENGAPQINSEVEYIWKKLNGSYKGTYYLFGTNNIWYTETIKFNPYPSVKDVFSIIDGKIIIYGTADIEDTRFIDISGTEHYYYSIVVKYQGATPYISFYKYGDDGSIINREDRRNIADISSSSFRMWGYGLTEAENSHIYNKE